MDEKINILIAKPQKDYALLDSGDGEKLERFGPYTLRRPDPQALWEKKLDLETWDAADAYFAKGEKTSWKKKKDMPEKWSIDLEGFVFEVYLSKFKHTGVFPEQMPNWQWIKKQVESEKLKVESKEKIKILNLFGYTGGATLAALKAGAEVVHVDASKTSIENAKANAAASGLADAPVRWILDDAAAFVKRELRRGNTYDGIIMDPPSFGRGPDGEVWKIEESFLPFIKEAKKLLSEKAIFFLLNGYAAGYSPLAYAENLADLKDRGGSIEKGEMAIEENPRAGEEQRLLPAGIFARWSRG